MRLRNKLGDDPNVPQRALCVRNSHNAVKEIESTQLPTMIVACDGEFTKLGTTEMTEQSYHWPTRGLCADPRGHANRICGPNEGFPQYTY